MGRGSGVQAEGTGLGLQARDAFHYGIAFLRYRAKHLQEGARVHGVALFDGKGIGAVGDIGHGHNPLIPEVVHGVRKLLHLLLQRLRVPQLIDLVDETGHARPLAEQPLHVGKLHMAVGVHKARAQDAVQEYRFGRRVRRNAGAQHGSVIVQLYKTV